MNRSIAILLALIIFNFYTTHGMNALRNKQKAISREQPAVVEKKDKLEQSSVAKKSEIQEKIEEYQAKIKALDKKIVEFIGESDPSLRRPKLPPYEWTQELNRLQEELEKLLRH